MPKPARFVQSFLCNIGLSQTDGQTDRHTQGRSYTASLAQRRAAKTIILIVHSKT